MTLLDRSLVTRRSFLARVGTGALAAAGLPAILRAQGAATRAEELVSETAFAGVRKVGEGIWAVVSTPAGGFDTVCNGGLVAGSERVLAFDSYASAAGAEWAIEQSRSLCGRAPTDLVLSHHHGDHVGGLQGFAEADEPPRLWLTRSVLDRIAGGQTGATAELLDNAEILDEEKSTRIDLGSRSVDLTPYLGHTPSDVVLRIDDAVTFYGDLLWNRFFPNYVDAIPQSLAESVTALFAAPTPVSVPGHGPLPEPADLELYRNLLDEIEATARVALEAGKSAKEAAAGYKLPASLGEWTLFNPGYFETAFGAWYKELGA